MAPDPRRVAPAIPGNAPRWPSSVTASCTTCPGATHVPVRGPIPNVSSQASKLGNPCVGCGTVTGCQLFNWYADVNAGGGWHRRVGSRAVGVGDGLECFNPPAKAEQSDKEPILAWSGIAAFVSPGSLSASWVHPREILEPVILYSAVAVDVAHNHPPCTDLHRGGHAPPTIMLSSRGACWRNNSSTRDSRCGGPRLWQDIALGTFAAFQRTTNLRVRVCEGVRRVAR